MSKKIQPSPERKETKFFLQILEDGNKALMVNNNQASCIRRSPFPSQNGLGQPVLNIPGCGSTCQFFQIWERERFLDEKQDVKTCETFVEMLCVGYVRLEIEETLPYNRFKK